MASPTEIKGEIAELDKLINSHDTIIKSLETSITDVKNVLSKLDMAYEGSATPFVQDFQKPFKEHIDLLYGCYVSSKAYITNAKDVLVEQDKKLAEETSKKKT